MATQEDFKKLKQELEELKNSLKNKEENKEQTKDETDNRSVTFTDYDTTTEKETTDSEKETTDGRERRKRMRKKKDLKGLLKSHQKIIKGLADSVNKKEAINETVAAEINNLSKKHIKHAITKTNSSFSIDGNNIPRAPKLREKGSAEIKALRETIGSLKDLYKQSFSGNEDEDVLGLLKHVGELAHSADLSIDQFYVLLKSRVTMGSPLYKEVCHHYNLMSPPRVLFKSLIPAYNTNRNYLKHLHRMTSYKPAPTESANAILTKVKTMAMEMSDSANNVKDKSEYVLSKVKDKIFTLYSHQAPTVVDHIIKNNPTTIGEFTTLFLDLAPHIETSNKKPIRHNILEIMEEDTSIHEISKSLPIKLTKAQAQKLDGCCFKCGSQNPDQGPHFGRDCIMYKDTPLAMYFCRRCDKGVHLPSFCKQSADSIQMVEIIDSDEYEREIKNCNMGSQTT